MRRRIAMMAVLGLLAAGLGCKHVGGKCDCQANPADAVMSGPTNPYPTVAAPSGTVIAPGTVTPAAPASKMTMPTPLPSK